MPLPNGEAIADKDHREHSTVSSDIPHMLLLLLTQDTDPKRSGGEIGADASGKFRSRKPCLSSKNLDPDEADFKPNVIHLMSLLRHNISSVEEQQDLSALKDNIPTSVSKTLSRVFGSVKVFIPQSEMANFTSCIR